MRGSVVALCVALLAAPAFASESHSIPPLVQPAPADAPAAADTAQAQPAAPAAAPEKDLARDSAPARPLVSAPPEAVASAPAPAHPRYATWTVAGAGGAALVAGGALALLSHSTSNDLTSGPHSTADVQSLQSKADSQKSASNALFIAGGVLVAAAAVLFVLHE